MPRDIWCVRTDDRDRDSVVGVDMAADLREQVVRYPADTFAVGYKSEGIGILRILGLGHNLKSGTCCEVLDVSAHLGVFIVCVAGAGHEEESDQGSVRHLGGFGYDLDGVMR